MGIFTTFNPNRDDVLCFEVKMVGAIGIEPTTPTVSKRQGPKT
jgi:hypothetical protein